MWFTSRSFVLNRFRIFTIQQVNHKIKCFFQFFVQIAAIWHFAKTNAPCFGDFVLRFRCHPTQFAGFQGFSACFGYEILLRAHKAPLQKRVFAKTAPI